MKILRKKSGLVGDKIWDLFRSALLWSKKVSLLKNRKIKVKGFGVKPISSHQIYYLERQLSFDRTPDHVHVRKDGFTGSIRFLFPCVGAKPGEFDYDVGAAEDDGFDYGFGVDGNGEVHGGKESYLREEEGEEYECGDGEKNSQLEEEEEEEKEGIDSRAEKFIAEFYGKKQVRD